MFDSGGTCTNCSIGSRKSVPGDEENLCLDCPTDSITDGPGKTMDTDCGMSGIALKIEPTKIDQSKSTLSPHF